MRHLDTARARIAALTDRPVADSGARVAAKAGPGTPDTGQALDALQAQLAALAAETQSTDRWASRARPTFLYVMYALLLWSIPMGIIAAFRPAAADAIARGMTAYLAGLPEPLYALFGTGYVGYTVAREWGKAKAG